MIKHKNHNKEVIYIYIHTHRVIYIYIYAHTHIYTHIKNPAVNAGDARDMDLIPGLGRSTGGRNGNPFQYSCLGNSMD